MEKIRIFTDERGGNLIPIELSELDFDPQRIFTVSEVPKGGIRGEHAHYETTQLLFCIKGSILVSLDYGHKLEETIINQGEYIFIDKMVWDYQQFLTGDDFMLAICSTKYDINDYILDKNEFYKKVKKI